MTGQVRCPSISSSSLDITSKMSFRRAIHQTLEEGLNNQKHRMQVIDHRPDKWLEFSNVHRIANSDTRNQGSVRNHIPVRSSLGTAICF